jgi:hypothetical protein
MRSRWRSLVTLARPGRELGDWYGSLGTNGNIDLEQKRDREGGKNRRELN